MDRPIKKVFRCAIYTRKSTEHNLDLEFNSLDAQREACEAYIKSQAHEGWRLIPDHYDDGAFSGASLERPALQNLLAEVRSGKIDIIVVYKVDRLTRALADFAKLVELFDQHSVSFVSVTQSFNTTSSMGRLTLNVLLSFAQFEREVIGERVRDKIAASKRTGIWMGGPVPLGYASQQEAGRGAGGRRDRRYDLRPLYRAWVDRRTRREPRSEWHQDEATARPRRANHGWHPVRGGSARLSAQEPGLRR
jgi:DNA invertase Pin-like site-specific DNA recombinase